MVKRIQRPEGTRRPAGMFAMMIFLLACAGCTMGGRKDVPGIQNFGQVSPEIWRGGKPTREGMQWLADRGVKTVIDLQMEDESADVPPGVRYVPIRVPMWHCDEVDVAAVNRAIEESPKPVFIHCVAGRDRTGLAVAAWRMSHGMSADDAIMEMETFGTNPWWNEAIKRRIRRLQEESKNGNATESAASER